MSNLIDELAQADADLEMAEAEVAEASRHLRHAKRDLRDCRLEVRRIIRELKTGKSRFPLLERIAPNGESISPNGTPDEHQRGPTAFPDVQSPAAAQHGKPSPKRRKKPAAR